MNLTAAYNGADIGKQFVEGLALDNSTALLVSGLEDRYEITPPKSNGEKAHCSISGAPADALAQPVIQSVAGQMPITANQFRNLPPVVCVS